MSSEFESVRRVFALLLITFMDKNAFTHVNVISKRDITLSKFVVLGNFDVVRVARNESHQKHQGVD